ncbi:MAG: hypothetical protein ABR591_14115 [Candidatus Velthaea sp.]
MKRVLEAKPTWKTGGVAIVCEKCTNVRFPEDFPECAGDERLDIKGWLKARLKAEGRWGPIRVVTASCLDVCARGGVTVLLNPLGEHAKAARCLVVDPLKGREDLYDAIVADLSPDDDVKHEEGAPA